MMIHFFYSPDNFFVIPTIEITAIRCDDCDDIHGWALTIPWLWFGVAAEFFFNTKTEA